MKRTLADKIASDMALNISELMRATGYGRVQINRMKLPLVEGKIRFSDFWLHVASLGFPKVAAASPVSSSDLRSGEDKSRAQRTLSAQQFASPYRVGLPPRTPL